MSLDLTIPGLPPTNAADRRSHWAYHKVSKEWQGQLRGINGASEATA